VTTQQDDPTTELDDFPTLTEKYQRGLLAHCYRMSGSVHEAEDLVQETFLRAWRGRAGFDAGPGLRPWLYRIATNACLDALDRRKARALPQDLYPPASPGGAVPPPITERVFLEPFPDDLIASTEQGPESILGEREGVALAFLALLQTLPGKQRAALVLRDVLGFSANETAEILDVSVAAANSALQRARETMDAHVAKKTPPPKFPDDVHARSVVESFMRAWEAGDADAVVALLTNDAVFSMPPLPLWFQGRVAIHAFVSWLLEPGRYKAIATRANGTQAIAVYEQKDGAWRPVAIDVFEIGPDGIRSIVAFLGADVKRFGAPESIAC